MRDILFRGKRVDNGEWVYGDLLTKGIDFDYAIRVHGANELGSSDIAVIDPATVGQYTGVKDMSGEMIFEGDIVRKMNDYYMHMSFVKQGIETLEQADKALKKAIVSVVEFCIEDVASCGCCYPSFNGTGFKAEDVDLRLSKVIGNIHDNPELLEENKCIL